jgi:hypothetical protein
MKATRNTAGSKNEPSAKKVQATNFVNKSVYDSDILEMGKPGIQNRMTDINELMGIKEAPAKELIQEKAVQEEGDYIFLPTKVVVKPYSPGAFRLGLEQQKEQFLRVPGVGYRWEPSIVGVTYRTGLDLIPPEKVKQLQKEVGRSLTAVDDEGRLKYYVDMCHVMDGSNPHGHHLDLTKAHNMLIYLAMLESHLIARNKLEKLNGSKPEAEWYIEDLEAEAEMDAKEQDVVREAVGIFTGLSDAKKAAFAKVMQLPVRGLSSKVTGNLLWKKLADNKSKTYTKDLERFIKISKWSDDKINVFAEIEDAIVLNILRRNGAQDFVYGDEVLGSTKEQVQNKLLMGENSGLRAAIKAKIDQRY